MARILINGNIKRKTGSYLKFAAEHCEFLIGMPTVSRDLKVSARLTLRDIRKEQARRVK